MSANEADLLASAIDGDADALTKLLERNAPDLRAWLRTQFPQKWRAEFDEDDVLQVTYEDAFRSISSFRPNGEGAFSAWLRRITRNNLLDAVKCLDREHKGNLLARSGSASSDDSVVELFDFMVASGTTPSQHLARQELIQRVRRAVGQLPKTYRVVIEHFDLRGAAAKDVALELGISKGAFYMRRDRALKLLTEILASFS